MKKLLLIVLSLAVIASLVPDASARDFVSAQSCILLEAETGRVLYEKDADCPRPMASTTKLMTALVVLENCDPDETVTVPAECVGIEGTTMYLAADEELTVRDLLCGLLVASGNDAASALAHAVSGGKEEFAARMNEKAAELGLTNSHFVNPHGLDAPEHYSSARDLAITFRALLDYDLFREIIGSESVSCAGREFTNHNKLLWSYDGMIGGKTGFTSGAGRCLVTAAERGGMTLICATLASPDDWNDHERLLDAGFTAYRKVRLSDGFADFSLPVISGECETVTVTADGDFCDVMPQDAPLSVEIFCPEFVYAPVTAGEMSGEIHVKTAGRETAIPLVYSESVGRDRSIRLTLPEKIRLLLRK